jgi:hypothetical protein
MDLKRQRDRQVWAAGEPSRADANLRRFARVEGEAVFCRRCDGDGVVLLAAGRLHAEPIRQCPRCGGEGLEPLEKAQHGQD